jgi:hypothetical protein
VAPCDPNRHGDGGPANASSDHPEPPRRRAHRSCRRCERARGRRDVLRPRLAHRACGHERPGPRDLAGHARDSRSRLLVVSTWLASRGSWRGLLFAIGSLAYLAYNDFLLLFATPFNPLFLVYVAAMSLTGFALATTIGTTDHAAVAERCPRVPVRGIAIYAWVVAFLNALVWLRTIVPATFAPDPTAFLADSGVATNPVFVQDLTFWLPGAALIGVLLWTRRSLGFVLGGGWLVYGLIEAIGVATDQWLGTIADPGTTQASMEGVALFVAVGLIALVPLFFFFRPEPGPRLAPQPRSTTGPA